MFCICFCFKQRNFFFFFVSFSFFSFLSLLRNSPKAEVVKSSCLSGQKVFLKHALSEALSRAVLNLTTEEELRLGRISCR